MMRRTISGRYAICATILALCFAAPAAAGPFEDAGAAYAKGDYATELRLLRPLADRGDARAQYNLGGMYANGSGVTQDDAAALIWYRKAGDQGNAAAQNSLGFVYTNGQGVPQDDAAALTWYSRSMPATCRDRCAAPMSVVRSAARPSTGHAATVASGAGIKAGEPGEALMISFGTWISFGQPSPATARPHLDSFEHDGALGAIGMTIGGSPLAGRGSSRHNLVFGRSQ
jgi:hypothetical protein